MAYLSGGVATSEGGRQKGKETRRMGGRVRGKEGGEVRLHKGPGEGESSHLLTLLGASLPGPGAPPAWTTHGPVPSL